MADKSEWWVNDVGTNMLKGVHGDESNPVMLDDTTIIDFLMHHLPARASFDRLYPTLLPDEQARFDMILEGSPMLTPIVVATIEDNFQHQWNTANVRMAVGPRGGGTWCPQPYDPAKGY